MPLPAVRPASGASHAFHPEAVLAAPPAPPGFAAAH